MEDLSGSLTPARPSGEVPISQAQDTHLSQFPPSSGPLMASSTPAGFSVPPTAATSMITIVPMDENGNLLSISRPQTAGGAGSGVHSEAAGKDQGSEQDAASKGADVDDNRQKSFSAPLAETVQQRALTFLLVSGRRWTMKFDLDTTIGRVKELVWNAWPSEWQSEQPPAPSYLRILYVGKMLQDDDTLSKLSVPPPTIHPTTSAPSPSPTIVHLSIRPVPLPSEDEGDLKKKGTRTVRRAMQRSTNSASGEVNAEEVPSGSCCGCVIS